MRISMKSQIQSTIKYFDDAKEAGLEVEKVIHLDQIRLARETRELAEEHVVQREKHMLRDRVDAFYRDNPDFRGSSADLAAKLGVEETDINYRRFRSTIGQRQRLLIAAPKAAE